MIETRPTRPRTVGTVAALVALSAATLLGCSSDDDDAIVGVTSTTTSTSAASSSTGVSNEAATSLLTAARLAREEVSGTTVVTVETERGGTAWEVHLVSADGTEHEVLVSADGRTVISGPVTEDDDADDRAEHRAEVAADRTGYERASEIVLDAVPEGTVTDLDLDTDGGQVVWEAEVTAADGMQRDVKVDAGSGAVIVNRVDT